MFHISIKWRPSQSAIIIISFQLLTIAIEWSASLDINQENATSFEQRSLDPDFKSIVDNVDNLVTPYESEDKNNVYKELGNSSSSSVLLNFQRNITYFIDETASFLKSWSSDPSHAILVYITTDAIKSAFQPFADQFFVLKSNLTNVFNTILKGASSNLSRSRRSIEDLLSFFRRIFRTIVYNFRNSIRAIGRKVASITGRQLPKLGDEGGVNIYFMNKFTTTTGNRNNVTARLKPSVEFMED